MQHEPGPAPVSSYKPSENQAMMECTSDRQTFLLNIKKGQMLLVLQARHEQDACNMYPYVSGEFTPVESYSKRE